jgi:hypothetical protein
VNKYAIENHYFNFSTAGQWLWNELRMTAPDTSSAYQVATQIREVVDAETETEAQMAEQDWERVTKQYGFRPFSANRRWTSGLRWADWMCGSGMLRAQRSDTA